LYGRRVSGIWGTFWSEPEQGARSVDLVLLRRAWTFVRPHRVWLGLLLVTIAVSSLLEVVPALVIRQIIDQALPRVDSRGLALLCAALLAVFGASTALLVAERWLSLRFGSSVVLALRHELYRHLQRMPLAFFTRARQGMIQSRLLWEAQGVESLMTATLGQAVTDGIGLVATLGAMFVLSPFIAGTVLLLVPLVLVPAQLVARRNRDLNRQESRITAELSTHVADRLSVAGALLARIFGGQAEDLRRFDERGWASRRVTIRMQMLQSLFVGALSLTGSLALVAIYFIGGGAVIGHVLSLGTLVALATLAQRVYGPVLDLASVRLNLISGLVALERVFEVLDREPMVTERPNPARPPRVEGRVEVDGVWFRYPPPAAFSIASLEADGDGVTMRDLPDEPSAWILRDVSLTAEPGTATALVGPTGAGKTTLSYLLARLYDVDQGCIRIDGVDIRDLAFDTLTGLLAMVPQDPHLFHDSIGANVRYARPEASDQEVVDACRSARIHDLIASLPDGYATMTGEGGYRLSGGEKQRLAIARAILKNPRVLILDEATSHLDNETEALVQEALREVMAGRTSFVIAHRLSTVRAADQIVVLDHGRIVERGDSRSLLSAGGLYRTLYDAGLEQPAGEVRA
jgi:ATP-binding cassette subfamily B protein